MSEISEIDSDEDGRTEPEALPLDLWHRARGGRMVEFAGYAMPVQYEGIIAEHLWTRESASLFDVSHMGQLELSGEGVAQALEALLPGDISALKPGRMRYSLLLDEMGGILDDLMVTNRGGTYYLVVNGVTKWDDIGHLREHLPDEITLNHLAEHGLLALQGPKAAEALGRLGLEPASSAMPALDALKFMQAGPFFWEGRPLGVSRSGYTGEDGFEISVRAEDISALADALTLQPEVKPAGLGARDSLRLEAGLPLYGHDLSEDTDPVTADLTFAISKARRAEGGFPGAGRILPLLADGAQRRRVGLSLEGRMSAREGARVLADDTEVGTVTSGGFSPTLQGPIAMAYVEAAYAAPGTSLSLEMRGKRLQATVVQMPFVPIAITAEERPMSRYFTKDHEWIEVENDTGTVGITDYAQSQLGDITYVELPAPETEVKQGDSVSVVDSVKAASDVYTPVSGKVVAVNDELADQPELVNTDAERGGWLFRIALSDTAELGELMDKTSYDAFVAEL